MNGYHYVTIFPTSSLKIDTIIIALIGSPSRRGTASPRPVNRWSGKHGKERHLSCSIEKGIDENTAQILSDGGIKVGDLKKMDQETLINNYGLKKDIATSVIEAVKSGPRTSSKQRFLADVLSKDGKPKVDKIEEQRFRESKKICLQSSWRRKNSLEWPE